MSSRLCSAHLEHDSIGSASRMCAEIGALFAHYWLTLAAVAADYGLMWSGSVGGQSLDLAPTKC